VCFSTSSHETKSSSLIEHPDVPTWQDFLHKVCVIILVFSTFANSFLVQNLAKTKIGIDPTLITACTCHEALCQCKKLIRLLASRRRIHKQKNLDEGIVVCFYSKEPSGYRMGGRASFKTLEQGVPSG